jgi:hypothetical protein
MAAFIATAVRTSNPKTEIYSYNIVMSYDTEQPRQGLAICELFSLMVDESTDVCDVFQLLAFNRLVFKHGNTMDELLTLMPLHGKTESEAFVLV